MGTIVCAGLGPGDPDLMSVKADRLVRTSLHVAYFRKKGRAGQARRIVEGRLSANVVEYAMEYPVTTEIPFGSASYNDLLAEFYDAWADRLATLSQTSDVLVLCEGDPFFYGSFMHLFVRLQGRARIEVIPGISGMSGCWTASQQPMAWGDDVLTVLPGTLPEAELMTFVASTDALVIMKLGNNLAKIQRALAASGKLDAAWLVERGTMTDERVMKLADVTETTASYFSIVLVHGHGRRPVKSGA